MMTDARPKVEQVAGDLRRRIRDGGLPPGARVPSEPDLMREWRISRGTAREAVSRLIAEGLIVSYPGLPRRVREHRPLEVNLFRKRTRLADAWHEAMDAAGRVPGEQVSVGVEAAGRAVAWRLRELEGADVWVRRVLRLADGEPHNLDQVAFPMEVAKRAPRLMGSASIEGGSVAYLTGLGWDLDPEPLVEFEWRMPSPDEAEVLRIPPGVPVLISSLTGRTGDEEPVFVAVTTWPGDRARLIWR